MKYFAYAISLLAIVCQPVAAQQSQKNAPTRIQGNTNIKASQKNATAVAVGKNNTAANEAGVIGGK